MGKVGAAASSRMERMASQYASGNAEVYEQLMGRWSRRLAVLFLDFAPPPRIAEDILDVGCGTGSLTFALASAAPNANVLGIDASSAFVAHARKGAADPRIAFEVADATALPYPDRTFSAAFSLLVLNFIPEFEKAAREMVRVTKPGGVVAASVWDFAGGLTQLRVFLDTAAALDPDAVAVRAKLFSGPLTAAGELATLWTALGLRDVIQASLTIRMDFRSFADYWEPWLGGQGSVGPYVAGLAPDKRAAIERQLRLAYLVGRNDGPRSFAATAWAVKGIR